MINFLNKIKPELALRLGLGAMYLYSGYDIFVYPTSWTWAIKSLPEFFLKILNTEELQIMFLKVQAVGELLIALVFLLWFLPKSLVKWVALFSAVEMALILWLVGLDPITFRDIGLFGASLGVFFSCRQKQYGL